MYLKNSVFRIKIKLRPLSVILKYFILKNLVEHFFFIYIQKNVFSYNGFFFFCLIFYSKINIYFYVFP